MAAGAVTRRPPRSERPVHLGLEFDEQVNRRAVEERQQLGKEHAAHALAAIDPEVGVAQARLPAARPVGSGSSLIRKLRPHFLLTPGISSTSFESAGIAVVMTGISRAPM